LIDIILRNRRFEKSTPVVRFENMRAMPNAAESRLASRLRGVYAAQQRRCPSRLHAVQSLEDRAAEEHERTHKGKG